MAGACNPLELASRDESGKPNTTINVGNLPPPKHVFRGALPFRLAPEEKDK